MQQVMNFNFQLVWTLPTFRIAMSFLRALLCVSLWQWVLSMLQEI
jgi:hypothetical protein